VHFRAAGLDVWLDVECLQPGDQWQKKIAKGLGDAQAFLVYAGRSGVARWVDFEVQVALHRHAKDPQFRVVPVLGPGADPSALPDFLKLFQWLDLRQGSISPDSLKSRDDGILFFGRERETEELLECLRRDPLLLVIGDSGCGKS
jgi:hypothetical protein